MAYRYILALAIINLLYSCKEGKEKTKLKVQTFSDGIRTEIYYLNDSIKHGLAKAYYPSGELNVELNYSNNKKNGEAKYYFSNGKLEAEVNYIDDLLDGESKHFFENGTLKSKTYWNHGREYGSAFFYDNKGRLTSYDCIDFEGNTMYVFKVDSVGDVIKEEGVVFSPTIKIEPDNSFKIKTDSAITFKITVAERPGYKVNLWTQYSSQGAITERKSQPIQNSTVTEKKIFSQTGNYGLIVIGEFRDQSDRIVLKDSVFRMITVY
jgi:hypothetical protein